MVLAIIAIAILFTLFILFAALQPKQGAKAANAPDDDPADDIAYQLPKPQIIKPQVIKPQVIKPQVKIPAPPSSPVFPSPALSSPPSPYVDPQDESPTAELNPDPNVQLRALVADHQRIAALKLIRAVTGWGLKDAKAYLDRMPNVDPLPRTQSSTQKMPPPAAFDPARHDMDDHIRLLLQQHRKIAAIKLVRQVKGYGLKDAKDYVESID